MKQKNLAVEMLRKLLECNIKAMEKRNLVKSEKFSERLTKALNKYRNQAFTNAEVIEELIRMAQDIKKMREEKALWNGYANYIRSPKEFKELESENTKLKELLGEKDHEIYTISDLLIKTNSDSLTKLK